MASLNTSARGFSGSSGPPVVPVSPSRLPMASTLTFCRIVSLISPASAERVSTTSTWSLGTMKPPEAESAFTAMETPRMPLARTAER